MLEMLGETAKEMLARHPWRAKEYYKNMNLKHKFSAFSKYLILILSLFAIEVFCLLYMFTREPRHAPLDAPVNGDIWACLFVLGLLVPISYILFFASLYFFRKSKFQLFTLLIINTPLIFYAGYVIITGHL